MDAVLHNELRISGKGKISGVMYIDGGYMDRDIPYIEGMKNACNPIVKNYTDTQENICYVDCGDEIIYLRSLPNGVHDEIDLETGKYIQRVGEVVLDGSEDWVRNSYSDNTVNVNANRSIFDLTVENCCDNDTKLATRNNILPDAPSMYLYAYNPTVALEGVGNPSGRIRVTILKNRLTSDTIDAFKQYLSENPITVQYELAEPIVKDIVIHNYPHSYEGGHVIIESGDPNTPIPAQLTYRAVTNRSGQIQQHTEQVEKQEREINELETLILANIHLSQTR